MKKVLITGKGSYIGTKVEEWIKEKSSDYEVRVLDVVGDDWKGFDFSGFDVVYHVAGIVHQKNISDELYDQVNHLLAVEVAQKAAEAGVKQFIFMSSGAVYSQSDKKHKIIAINNSSDLKPSTAYGKSKLQAEHDIAQISTNMAFAVIRPPMVYGRGARGNYNKLAYIAKKVAIFPKIDNKRSMIFIDNLCEFIRILIDSGASGIFLPQNKEYVNTSALVQVIAKNNGKSIHLTTVFNGVISFAGYFVNIVNKVFGDFYYEKENYFNNAYQLVEFEDSIRLTEAKE